MKREPRTEAGKRLDLAWPGSHIDRLDWRDRILAIEAEAAAQGGLREALTTLLDDAFVADHGSIDGGPAVARGIRYAVTAIERAALAAQPTPEPVA